MRLNQAKIDVHAKFEVVSAKKRAAAYDGVDRMQGSSGKKHGSSAMTMKAVKMRLSRGCGQKPQLMERFQKHSIPP